MWHWARLWEWEQYEYEEPLRDVTPAEKAQLDAVKSRIESIIAANMSSANYINGTIIPRARATFEKAAIRRTDDGGIIGAPLLSNDECNRPKGELRLDDIENMLNAFALNSHINNDPKYDDDFFLVMDHAIDQGFAFGHGNGTNHHYGYNIRKIYDAMWLMRDKIAARGKTDEYVKVLAYWSGLAETRKPYVYGRDELLDSWHTLLIPKIVSALMLPDEAEQYRAMKSLGVWLSGSLGFTPGTIGGIKPDGTTFHHGGFYPAYSTGAFAMIGYFCKATRGTDFTLSEQARRNFKLALMTMASYTDLRDWGLGLAGRHPFGKNGRIPDADVNAFGYLAALGDLTGSGKGADPELAGAYLRLKGTDKELNSLFRKEGISAGPTPSGFFVYNYGAAGIHRRGDWMVTLKAFNTDVWGSEIYTKDNRYGRYQSYGSAPIIGSGNPVSAAASGFVQEGWDWNRVPGATTIHLPYPELESPLPGTLMERNPERFSGASSLEGRNGILALHFVEKDRKNFTPGATAYKSVFCFDNRMVFLGSGIDNDNQAYPTETTLFQLRMDSPAEQIEVDGELYDAFPLNLSKGGERLALSDTKGNFYVVKNAAAVNITKKEQTSPNDKTRAPQTGNFATAWIDHGRAPQAGRLRICGLHPAHEQGDHAPDQERRLRSAAPGQHGPRREGPRHGHHELRLLRGIHGPGACAQSDRRVDRHGAHRHGRTGRDERLHARPRPHGEDLHHASGEPPHRKRGAFGRRMGACRTISRRGGRFPRHRNAAEDNLPPRTARGVPAQEEITIFTHNLIYL